MQEVALRQSKTTANGDATGDVTGPSLFAPQLASDAMQALEDVEPGKFEILFAAALCFMESGFTATSIDDVAARLGATKGRVYHYYRSKADLFFDVHRIGMKINLGTIQPIAEGEGKPLERLEAMCRRHVQNMLSSMEFQRVVMQGVEMHLAGRTNQRERDKLRLLMDEREAYEMLFQRVMVEAREEGALEFESASFASKALLGVLNNPVLWYRRREDEGEEERVRIVAQFTQFALRAAGASKYFNKGAE